MKIYHIIDKNERSAREELKPYTLEGLKACFRCDEEDFPEELAEELENVQDIADLEEYLKHEYNGDEVPYNFEEEEDETVGVLYMFESITDDDNTGFQLFYNTEKEALRVAAQDWNSMSERDKKHTGVYVVVEVIATRRIIEEIKESGYDEDVPTLATRDVKNWVWP